MTSRSNDLLSTTQVTKESKYFDSPEEFFNNFPDMWKNVKSQVLKLETRQFYFEPNNEKGNQSFRLYKEGNFSEAKRLIYYFRSGDVNLYKSLKERKVDFIRCRPIELPMIDYLKWEIECYHFNSFHGENIYFFEQKDLKNFFKKSVHHDFMIFDRKKALIHNYDKNGEIQGGWIVSDTTYIDNLIMIYSIIRAASVEYSIFLKRIFD